MNPKIGAVLAFVVRFKSFYPLIRLLGAVAIAWIITQFPLQYIEGILYDARMRLSPAPAISQEIATVSVDLKTMQTLNTDPNALDYALLLQQINLDNPKAVIILDDPTNWEGAAGDKQELLRQARMIPQFYFATDQISPVSSYSKLKLPAPYDQVNLGSAPLTRDNISFAGDKVTRRLMLSFEDQATLQVQLAKKNPQDVRGNFEADGSKFTFIRYAPKDSFKALSFIDVRDGRFPKGTFTNKIILIGTDNGVNSEDYVLTPLSRDPLAMSRLETQANVINTLLNNNGIKKSQEWFDFVITCLVSYLTVLIVWSARPLKGITLLGVQAVTLAAVSLILFFAFGFWINLVHPLLTILVSYYFFIPYRLIVENKRGWEFEQKNKLLTQVEELKTNFMSMMSHDLKTPLARIQGMAEIALNDEKDLSHQQKNAIKTIMRSGEELSSFIGSILDLSRIESKEMKLHKTSKDINALIQEVVKKYDFQAAAKSITINTNLDPLFSIKVDVDLIRQVIANLVENAIKYSPENSSVTIESREENGKIVISVSDQGAGIAQDEIDNVFLKFYRSKSAKASPTKGTGLGLYLAKYFVELHEGKIQVESDLSKGSRFNIELPM